VRWIDYPPRLDEAISKVGSHELTISPPSYFLFHRVLVPVHRVPYLVSFLPLTLVVPAFE
jgi:hypothetical protein